MSEARRSHVVVVGGGLAGLAAAIECASRGLNVTLVEKGLIGRDKVCGEFLSPEVERDLAALGCADWVTRLGARPMRSVLIRAGEPTAAQTSPAELELDTGPRHGHSVTRSALEAMLAERARRSGVRVAEMAPVAHLGSSLTGFRLELAGAARGQVLECDHVILAMGKRSSLDAELGLPRARRKQRFAAAKVYFAPRADALRADVELYLLEDGSYVGLNAVEDGRVGLCALLVGSPAPTFASLRERLVGARELARTLDRLGEPLGPVRGLFDFGFGPQLRVATIEPLCTARGASARAALLCGDAARMMPPFTGDGMAVALRSGRLASHALAARDPARAYSVAHRREFAARAGAASLLHRAFLNPRGFRVLSPLLARSPRVLRALYSLTRGA